MRILQVVDQLDIGGAERVVVDLSNILCCNGEDVTLLSIRGEGPLNQYLDDRIHIKALRRSSKFSLRYMYRFISIAKKFDIIHVHMRHTMRYVALATCFYPSLRKKIIFHDHYGPINEDISFPLSLSLSLSLKYCIAAYVGVSQELVSWAKYNGISNCSLLSNIIRKQESEKHICGNMSFVSVGNIKPIKNYLHLVEIAKAMPQANFTIYGNKNDSDYYNKVVASAGNNVHIIEHVFNVQPLLGKYKIAIHNAQFESGPLVLIEYMAQGIPFITYRTGEVVKQISNDLPELIMDNFNVSEWIERIKYIEDNYETIRIKILNVYEKHYSEDNYYQSCIKIYQKVGSC